MTNHDSRGWDGVWRTLHQSEDETRRILMRWSKEQLVNHHIADWQRKVQNENCLADRLVTLTAERDALRAELHRIKNPISQSDQREALLGREPYPPEPRKPLRTLHPRRIR